MIKYLLLTMSVFAFAKASIAQSPSAEVLAAFKAESFEYQGKLLPYRILMPKNFDATKKYPLHLFLHGSGERGSDNQAQLVHGSELFLENNKEFPAVVIFPQCPAGDYWADVSVTNEDNQNIFTFPENPKPTWAMRALLSLIDHMLTTDYIDKNRAYIQGLSMGGMGTFELLYHRPDTFAAANAICGAGYPDHVQSWAKNTPIWISHGEDDPVVPAIYSKLMVEALLRNGAQPKASFYPNVQHDSWTNTFAEETLFSWIYSQLKNNNIDTEQNEDCTPEWLKFSEKTLLGKYLENNMVLQKEANPNRIIFIGDSITEGWPEASPEFWKDHPNFVNRGVSGQTTPQMLVRFRQDVIHLNPKTVVILAGTNDIAGNTGETSIETIAHNIFTMADLAKMYDIKVIIPSVLPVYDYPWKPGLYPAPKIIELNKMLKAYAQKEGHTYLDYHTDMKNDLDGMKENLSYDGVHCTKEGYAVMEALLLQKLK